MPLYHPELHGTEQMSPATDGKLGQAVPKAKGCPVLTSSTLGPLPAQLGNPLEGWKSIQDTPGRPQPLTGQRLGSARVSFARFSPSLHLFQGLRVLGPSSAAPPLSTSSHQPYPKPFAAGSHSRAGSPGTPLLLGALHLHLLIKPSPKKPQ